MDKCSQKYTERMYNRCVHPVLVRTRWRKALHSPRVHQVKVEWHVVLCRAWRRQSGWDVERRANHTLCSRPWWTPHLWPQSSSFMMKWFSLSTVASIFCRNIACFSASLCLRFSTRLGDSFAYHPSDASTFRSSLLLYACPSYVPWHQLTISG